MTNDILDRYLKWIEKRVGLDKRNASYSKLLYCLYCITFYYVMQMDENRYYDGLSLKYRFAYETGEDTNDVSLYLKSHTCSVLEMMVALALRCEEDIMYDVELGDRTEVWFFDMLKSLGIDGMDNKHFDSLYIYQKVDRFLARAYQPNGCGGLFTVEGRGDLREIEIWYQMQWYLDQKCKNDISNQGA